MHYAVYKPMRFQPLTHQIHVPFQCQSITSSISSTTAATQAAQVAYRVCTAVDYCMPRSVADQCPFGVAKTAKSPFEAALDIVSIIAQSVQPYMVAKMPELRSTFLVMDETAKVIIITEISFYPSSVPNMLDIFFEIL